MKFYHKFKLYDHGNSFRVYKSDDTTMRIDFFEGILRVALIRDKYSLLPTWSVCPHGTDCPPEGRSKLSRDGFVTLSPEVYEDDDVVKFIISSVSFKIELENFRITAETANGLLYSDRSGLAYNFDGELGDGTVHFTCRKESQKIFGLGDKCGSVNKSGRSFELGTTDSMGFKAEKNDPLYKHVPFYICENDAGSYGIYYDTYSSGRVNFGEEHDNYFEPFNSVRYEEDNMVYYLILGDTPNILKKFIWMTGGIANVPEWAFKYCGSTMEYTDAPDTDRMLRSFIECCEKEKIEAGGFYLSSGYTQIGDQRCVFHWNRDKIPDPKNLSDHFRKHGLEIIPNVKPAFLTTHPMYEMIAKNGWFLHYKDGTPARFPFWGGFASYLDFTNQGAYDFWKSCIREHLVRYGYRNIWNDNNEYDVWDSDVIADGFGHPIKARLLRPLFSFLMSRASREACAELSDKNAIPFMVSRCAVAGTQRVATTWTGDNYTSFRELRFNHYQAMTMSLSGFCFFGQDIGGFSGPSPSRELFLRWLQYGIFTPRFVLHSWKPGERSNMPWLYPDLMPVVRKLFNLRSSFIPYLKEQMEKCISGFRPLIFPVFLNYPGYDTESDLFMCGDEILVCPVFDEGKIQVPVCLPGKDENWALRDSGEKAKGGSTVIVPCAPEDEPVWFRKI